MTDFRNFSLCKNIDFFMNSFWCELDGENLRKKAPHITGRTQQNHRGTQPDLRGAILLLREMIYNNNIYILY